MIVRLESRVSRSPRGTADQSGVALLQVLLLSALMSLLAIRFTETARDQVEIAGQIDNRIRAQLVAHSIINEAIFIQVSHSVTAVIPGTEILRDSLINQKDINFYGAPIAWRQGVTVQIQDLNGLLPQIFPEHPLWREVLKRWPLPSGEINRYLGVMKDVQDNDNRSWIFGDSEPAFLPSGQAYLNGYFQNSKPMEWIFEDRPELLAVLLDGSDVYGTWGSNPSNYPDSLLRAVFDSETAEAIVSMRNESKFSRESMGSLLPSDFSGEHIVESMSGRFKIAVDVDLEESAWREQHTILLRANSKPPFVTLLRD